MRHQPSLDEFLKLAHSHSLVPVYRQLIGDTLTPVTAFRKIQDGDWSFLFESVIGGERLGRYSFIGSRPFLRFQAWDRQVRIEFLPSPSGRGAGGEGEFRELRHDDPLKLLEETL